MPATPSPTSPTRRPHRAIRALRYLTHPQVTWAVLGMSILGYATLKKSRWRWKHLFDWW
jgi:hypothetical protein